MIYVLTNISYDKHVKKKPVTVFIKLCYCYVDLQFSTIVIVLSGLKLHLYVLLISFFVEFARIILWFNTDSNFMLVMSLVLPISYLEMPLFQIDRPSVHIIYFQCITHSTDVTIAPLLCISLLSPIKWTEKWSFLKIWQNLVVVRICEQLGCWVLSEMSIDVF